MSTEKVLRNRTVHTQTCSHEHKGCVLRGQIQKEHLILYVSLTCVCSVFSCSLKGKKTLLECWLIVKPLCLSLPWSESIQSNCVCVVLCCYSQSKCRISTCTHKQGKELVSTATSLSGPDERSHFSLKFKVWPHQKAGTLIGGEPVLFHQCLFGAS